MVPTDSGREAPRWPDRLRSACAVVRSPGGDARRQAAFEEAWILLHAAIHRALDRHARRFGGADREDLEDLAAEKSLELVRKLESGTWDPATRQPGELVSFVSTVARNGLVDLFRARGRETALPEEPEAPPDTAAPPERPEDRLERRRFAESLKDCAGQLAARDRTVWFFRVFYDLPSREIADHPEVGLKAPHVDVILQRCRQAVRRCMGKKGYEPGELPPGTFSELWAALRAPASPERPDE